MKIKNPTKRNSRLMRAVSGMADDNMRSPRCFESQTEAAEFLRERAVKRISWNVKPNSKINDIELLCRKKACSREKCESRGALVDAQNIINKAFSESNANMKVRLARAALTFDERCVDAHLVLSQYDENKFTSKEKHCHNAIEAGMLLYRQSTKPYLRALSALAEHQKQDSLDALLESREVSGRH